MQVLSSFDDYMLTRLIADELNVSLSRAWLIEWIGSLMIVAAIITIYLWNNRR